VNVLVNIPFGLFHRLKRQKRNLMITLKM